jgi:hypothetical protein
LAVQGEGLTHITVLGDLLVLFFTPRSIKGVHLCVLRAVLGVLILGIRGQEAAKKIMITECDVRGKAPRPEG